MRRALLVSLSLAALGWMAGCGGSGMLGGGGGGGNTPNALSGQYAILLSGFDSNGSPMGIAGSIKADGLGHITGGELDVSVNGSTSTPITSLAGSYGFDNAGLSTLGTITLTNTINGHALAFGFALQGSGAFGQIMDLDANNFIVSGTMQLQSSPILSLSGMAGDYVVTLRQSDSATSSTVIPTSLLGRFTLGSAGGTTVVAFDRSIAGVGTAQATAATVTFAAAGPDTNGRGTFSLGLTDGLTAPTNQTFAYYAITANRIVAVETDASGAMTADFSRQQDSTPFTASTVVTAGSVFGMAGVDLTAGNEIAAVGQLTVASPGTSTSGGLAWDSNDNGTIVGPATASNQAVTFDPSTGRGTVAITNGFTNGLADIAVFYLTAPGTGFILDATTGLNNRAMVGPLTVQATGGFSANTDLSALGIVRARGASVGDADALIGAFGPTATAGTYALQSDERFPGTSSIQTSLEQTSSAINVGTLSASTGRATLLIPANTSTEVIYIIGPNQFVLMDITGGASSTPEVFFVSPR